MIAERYRIEEEERAALEESTELLNDLRLLGIYPDRAQTLIEAVDALKTSLFEERQQNEALKKWLPGFCALRLKTWRTRSKKSQFSAVMTSPARRESAMATPTKAAAMSATTVAERLSSAFIALYPIAGGCEEHRARARTPEVASPPPAMRTLDRSGCLAIAV